MVQTKSQGKAKTKAKAKGKAKAKAKSMKQAMKVKPKSMKTKSSKKDEWDPLVVDEVNMDAHGESEETGDGGNWNYDDWHIERVDNPEAYRDKFPELLIFAKHFHVCASDAVLYLLFKQGKETVLSIKYSKETDIKVYQDITSEEREMIRFFDRQSLGF